MVTLHMPLLNEGTDVWRPVEVTPVEGGVYLVEGPMPVDEEWAFSPGTVLNVRWKTFPDGEQRLIPTGPSSVRSTFEDYFKRTIGLLPGPLILMTAMEWLPRAPEGHPEPVPLFFTSAGVALVSLAGMVWLKPRPMIAKWALGSAFGFGVLLCLMSVSESI